MHICGSMTPLELAVEEFLCAYREKYRNHGKGGIRASAPMRLEALRLAAALNDERGPGAKYGNCAGRSRS